MKKVHWVLLVVVLVIGGVAWLGNNDGNLATCPNCACANVSCCDSGVCEVADCDCSCKN